MSQKLTYVFLGMVAASTAVANSTQGDLESGYFQENVSLSVQVSEPILASSSKHKPIYTSASPVLALFQGTDSYGWIEITNTSGNIASDVTVTGLPEGVTTETITPTTCTTLGPQQVCKIKFNPGGSANPGTSVGIFASGRIITSIIVQVLGNGDYYQGNQLFELPTSLNAYTYYTALANDIAPGQDWLSSIVSCANLSAQMPAAVQLTLLYNNSNCASGSINNFDCTKTYFSSTQAFDIDHVEGTYFLNGTHPVIAKADTIYYTRCVISYTLPPLPTS